MFSKPGFIRAWYAGATVFTCLTIGRDIGDRFFDGSQIPWAIAIIPMFLICWGARPFFNKATSSSTG